MMQEAKNAAVRRKKTTPEAGKPAAHANNGAAFQHYQSAVQLVQQGKYDKALSALEKLLPTAPPEIVERCRMYIATCQRQLDNHGLSFATPEERFDFAIAQLNGGDFEDARQHLDALLAEQPEADYVFYGLAALDSITGRTQECLSNLARAIELNPRNRLQARSDNDFQNMADDPRFTELLYPEIP